MDDEVESALVRAIEARDGVIVEKLQDGRLKVNLRNLSFTLYLDNLRRRVQMGDSIDSAVSDFLVPLTSQLPEVEPAQRLDGMRLMLEQVSVVDGTETVSKSLSPEVAIILVWTDPDESRIRFVQSHLLATWDLQETPAWSAARSNMERLLAKTPIKMLDARGLTLGVLETDSVFKASLITAPSLRGHVADTLGWPVLAVTPCRDFLYLIPQVALDQLGRIGKVVEREFTQSAYPLSQEVFQIDDKGIRPIGRFGATSS